MERRWRVPGCPKAVTIQLYFSIVPVQASTLTMYTGNGYILVGGKTQKIRPEYRALHTTEALHRVLTWLGIGD